MKPLKILLGAAIGILLATVICWGGLYAYGVFVLHGAGSLFDTNPNAANLFFYSWFAMSFFAAIAGAFVAGRGR
jgi:hypothetical protein